MTLVLSGDGSVGPLTATEIGYLDSVTSSVQTQLDSKVNVGSAGIVSITSGLLSGPSVLISDIPQTYKNLYLTIHKYQPATDAATFQVQVNGDTAAARHYSGTATVLAATVFGATQWTLSGVQDNTVSLGFIACTILNYASSSSWTLGNSDAVTNDATTATSFVYQRNVLIYNQLAAVTSLVLKPSTGAFTSGTYTLYGVN